MTLDISGIPPARLHEFYREVNRDARARLEASGIEVGENEMAGWTAMFVHLKQHEEGRNGFFNAMCALAVSEAALEDTFQTGNSES